MIFKTFLKKVFFGGELIEKFYSPLNGEILVLENLRGNKFIRVGGITQSGGVVEEIWKNSIIPVLGQNLKISNSLILGLGCGSVAMILSKKLPGIKMVGVEIDPEIIKIGKKYFELGKIPNLKIILKDAISLVEDRKFIFNNTGFDLILVDLYLGQDFPPKAETKEFLNGLKKLLSKDGLIIFNRLYFGIHKKKTDDFHQKLKGYFSEIKKNKIGCNIFIYAK